MICVSYSEGIEQFVVVRQVVTSEVAHSGARITGGVPTIVTALVPHLNVDLIPHLWRWHAHSIRFVRIHTEGKHVAADTNNKCKSQAK